MKSKFLGWICAVGLVGFQSLAQTQEVAITGWGMDGSLVWTNQATSGWYIVEWASTPGGEWHSTWQNYVMVSSGVRRISVPLFYRITHVAYGWCTVQGEIVAVANGVVGSYGGYLNNTGLRPSSLVIRAGDLIFTDPEPYDGALVTSNGASGNINYDTGQWAISLGGNVLTNQALILADYRYACQDFLGSGSTNSRITTNTATETLGYADGYHTAFSFATGHAPIVAGSISISAGGFIFTDPEGDGTLAGNLGATESVGYADGHISIYFPGVALSAGQVISASCLYTLTSY